MVLKRKNKLKKTINHYDSLIAEEYEFIRTNIEFTVLENNCKVIGITSPSGGEGKSTTVANLALSLAEMGKKVLIIDMNVRNPMINKMFHIKNTIGLTNILVGQKHLEEVIVQTGEPLIGVIPAGPIPYNTERLFKSQLMDQLFESAQKIYDLILVDGPSILAENEAKIIANRCDGVVMVIQYGKTEDTVALEAKKSLIIAKAKLLGVVINAKRKVLFS
ncbi:CpsD/CapB family tyrosine-protein kinase [Alkalihalobacillus pseudalcaliphilus]|uniref:CpsD/CapB family tyrosine-protein kinase n=1 Tax=Alkalihalobacillus pseudalcaliphilus TaxID=79884 RepID=UPI00064DAC95|nr:CpsD/CapB family tyrosine-protein kinase [Alkalihalobacillus pseudalcaliphilus]KMK75041.1 hypothetical protein AB990_16360 [Alkalihalobacillus pseudalcaliphilus]